jgi:hypothetical protein
MRQRGRGRRCRPRSLGAWPRGTARASRSLPIRAGLPGTCGTRVRPGPPAASRGIRLPGARDPPLLESDDSVAVPMRLRISSSARCPRSGFALAARACNRRYARRSRSARHGVIAMPSWLICMCPSGSPTLLTDARSCLSSASSRIVTVLFRRRQAGRARLGRRSGCLISAGRP